MYPPIVSFDHSSIYQQEKYNVTIIIKSRRKWIIVRGISYSFLSNYFSAASLSDPRESDCCQRGPICSLWSQLANSSVCIRFINVLIKPRSPLFFPPNKILFERSHSLSLFLSPLLSAPLVISLFLRTVSIIRLLGSRQPRLLFPGDDLDPRPPWLITPFHSFVASFSSEEELRSFLGK